MDRKAPSLLFAALCCAAAADFATGYVLSPSFGMSKLSAPPLRTSAISHGKVSTFPHAKWKCCQWQLVWGKWLTAWLGDTCFACGCQTSTSISMRAAPESFNAGSALVSSSSTLKTCLPTQELASPIHRPRPLHSKFSFLVCCFLPSPKVTECCP